ncbi:hypothetical protein MINTM021_25850 [Mycobacterium paraintracellulare]|nr:hypothetical protein MINTM021_25850 [Mycobacterium paraintracellulare]
MTTTTVTAGGTASKHSQPPRRSQLRGAHVRPSPKSFLECDTPPGYNRHPLGVCNYASITAGQRLAGVVCYCKHYRRSGPGFLLLTGAAGRVAPVLYGHEKNKTKKKRKNPKNAICQRPQGICYVSHKGAL